MRILKLEVRIAVEDGVTDDDIQSMIDEGLTGDAAQETLAGLSDYTAVKVAEKHVTVQMSDELDETDLDNWYSTADREMKNI